MLCKRCASNGEKRDGGPLGACARHSKTKCNICGRPSLGLEQCVECARGVDLLRWRGRSRLQVFHPTREEDFEALYERLQEARFLVHEAVEVFFHGLVVGRGAVARGEQAGDINNIEKDAA